MDQIEHVRRALMTTTSDSSWVAARAVESGTLVRIARGCFLETAVLSEVSDDVWQQRWRVDVARILAVTPSVTIARFGEPADMPPEGEETGSPGGLVTDGSGGLTGGTSEDENSGAPAAFHGVPDPSPSHFGSAGGRVVAFESALVIRGLPVLDPSPDVHVVAPNARSARGRTLPAVTFRGRTIRGPARLVIHRLDHAGRGVEVESGIVITDSATTAIDLARFRPPREAIAEVSVLLNRVTGFARASPEASRAREHDVKASWLGIVAAIGGIPGVMRARRVIGAADAGCESIAEGVLTWFLHAFRIRPWHTQAPTSTGVRIVYPDVRIDDALIVLECEGQKKLGNEPDEIARNAHLVLRRSNELSAAGWRVVFIPASEILGEPRALEADLQRVAPEIFEPRRGLDPWWFLGMPGALGGGRRARDSPRADDRRPEPQPDEWPDGSEPTPDDWPAF